MTKRRPPLTFHRALTTIAASIGWDQCAAICGVTERAVRNWSDPDTDAEIRLIDALRLDQAYFDHGGDHAPFHQCFGLRLDISARGHEDSARDMFNAVAAAAKESGEAVSALVKAAGPGAGIADRRRARKETEDAIGALTDSLAALGTEGLSA